MQQGAGAGHVDPAGEAEECGEGGQRLLVVVDPDVAAVDHARDEPFAGQPAGGGEVREVGGGVVGEVQCQSVHRGLRQYGERLAEPVEVRGDEQLGPVGQAAEFTVRTGSGVQLGRRPVLDQCGLVELDPFRAGGAQIGEYLRVDRQQTVQQGERFEAGRHPGGGLGEQQVRDGADEHRPGGVSEREGFPQFGDLLGGVGGEDGVRAEFGDEVVVVGVEPLGHLQRRHVLGAAGHREVAVERVGFDGLTVPAGDRADHDAGVQDVVVVGEVAGGYLVDTGVRQLPPVGPAQAGRRFPEGVGGDPALPVTLDGLFQFPVRSLAGVAVHGGVCCRGCGLCCHGNLLREMTP